MTDWSVPANDDGDRDRDRDRDEPDLDLVGLAEQAAAAAEPTLDLPEEERRAIARDVLRALSELR